MQEEKEMIYTKFGKLILNPNGYYQISSSKEGNFHKLLHRLVWEDWYGKLVPKGYDIHHINGDKTDNRIQNLQCVEHRTHMRFHNKNRTNSEETRRKISEANSGENHPMYGKNHTIESKKKMSKSHKGLIHSEETKRKISENSAKIWEGKTFSENHKKALSKSKNSTGYYRVGIHKDKQFKQGFCWSYKYYENGKVKSLYSVDLKKLEEKVKAKGLEWEKFEEDKQWRINNE